MAIGPAARGLLLLALAAAPGSVDGFQGIFQRWSKPVVPGVKQQPAQQALGSAASSSTDLQGLSGTYVAVSVVQACVYSLIRG